MSDEPTDAEIREEARASVPDRWVVDDLAQVMRPADARGVWVSVWMWMWLDSGEDEHDSKGGK